MYYMLDVLFLDEELTLARRIKVARVARDLRQGDVAYLATQWAKAHGLKTRVRSEHVSYLERGFGARKFHTQAILAVLGLEISAL